MNTRCFKNIKQQQTHTQVNDQITRFQIMKIRGTKTDISPVNSNGSPVYNVQLTERLSPDGGEAESKTSGEEEEEEGEAWSDWENNVSYHSRLT